MLSQSKQVKAVLVLIASAVFLNPLLAGAADRQEEQRGKKNELSVSSAEPENRYSDYKKSELIELVQKLERENIVLSQEYKELARELERCRFRLNELTNDCCRDDRTRPH